MSRVTIKDKTFETSIPEAEILERVKAVAAQINQDMADKNPLFLAVLNGAFVFAADLMREITIPCEISFVKLASYQGTTSTGKVHEVLGVNENLSGRTIVIIEDIVDTGLTMKQMIESLGTRNPETIEKIVQSHKVLADEKNIQITVIKEDNLPKVPYNTQAIERVVSNLITNAIKYSPNDSRVKIRAEIAKDPKYLEVTVEDNGIGIAPEHQKMIFERFYRIENQVHTVKGTGLGLHLVKVTIEKHHQGKVFVRSKLNEGSTFGFWLPIEEADVRDVSLKELKDKTLNEIPVNDNNRYQEYKIEKAASSKAAWKTGQTLAKT